MVPWIQARSGLEQTSHLCQGHTCSQQTKGHTAEKPGAHDRVGPEEAGVSLLRVLFL